MTKFIFILLMAAVNSGLSAPIAPTAEFPVRISAANKWIIVDKSLSKAPKLEVSIIKSDGTILINENIRASKKYNLRSIPDGDYTLELEDNQSIKIQQFKISNGLLYSTGTTAIYKPLLKINANHIDMNLMTQGLDAEVSIRTTESNTFFSEKIKDEVSVIRRYNIDQLPEGDYIIEVSIAGQHFTTLFTK